jgi:hypothetical protein
MHVTSARTALLAAGLHLAFAVEGSYGRSSPGTSIALLSRTSRIGLTPHVEAREDATEKAKAFVAQLETVEKIGLVTGGYGKGAALPCVGSISAIERLNFTGLCYSDGPSGYGRADGVTVFPSGITVAATWDSDLMYERAVAIGEEFRDKGSHVHLGYDRTTLCNVQSPVELTIT